MGQVAVSVVDQAVVDLDNSGIHRDREGQAARGDPSEGLLEGSFRTPEEADRADPASDPDPEHAEVDPSEEAPFLDVPLAVGPSDQDRGSCSVVAAPRSARVHSQPEEDRPRETWSASVGGPYRGRADQGMIEACRTGRSSPVSKRWTQRV